MTIIGHPVRKEVLRGCSSLFAASALWERLTRALAENELRQNTYKMRLPGVPPHIVTGMRFAVVRALLAVVVAELTASNAGSGYLLRESSET